MSLTVGVLTGGSNNHETTSEEVNALATDFVNEGIAGSVSNTNGVAPATGGFAVNAQGTPAMAVDVSAGTAYVDATPSSQSSQTLRVKNSATAEVTIAANSSGSTKYDWVYISLSASNAANPNTAADNVATLVTSRSSSASTDDGTPPTYGYALAVVTVANGASNITNSSIRDIRSQVALETGTSVNETGWSNLGFTPNTVTANGNRSYDLVFNSTDLTDTVSPGMRLKLTRTVTAPTQCTDLEASSSQYYSKTSPAGMTFTDDFVVSAWIKLESYVASSIASRYNGTSGWDFQINASGQVRLVGVNASSANTSEVVSYQSVPLGKWVHVAAQLDMSAFTATTTTSYVMIDGVNVPASVSRAGTNPTALVQAGNLEIGGRNGGLQPFDGKLAQVAIYSAKVTQATILASMNQTLSGSETSLVSAYSFNNSINDLNANANNLTAQGSAVATATDSPFAFRDNQATGVTAGTTEYAIVTKSAFSTNTTLTVQVPEGCAIPTSGGVSAVSYSTQKVPYGFPAERDKWRLASLLRTSSSTTSNATYGAFLAGGWALGVPVGAWLVGWQASLGGTSTTIMYYNISTTALTGMTASAGSNESPFATIQVLTAAAFGTSQTHISRQRVHNAAVTYVFYTLGASTAHAVYGADGIAEIYAELAYV